MYRIWESDVRNVYIVLELWIRSQVEYDDKRVYKSSRSNGWNNYKIHFDLKFLEKYLINEINKINK